MKLPYWLKGNKLFFIKNLQTDSNIQGEAEMQRDRTEVTALGDANIISSESKDFPGHHYLFLDLDQDHVYLPSTTEGHGHLIVRTLLKYDEIGEIIRVLAKHGILQEGIEGRWVESGAMYLRLPGVTKSDDKPNPDLVFGETIPGEVPF
jgi:hypothetical protein